MTGSALLAILLLLACPAVSTAAASPQPKGETVLEVRFSGAASVRGDESNLRAGSDKTLGAVASLLDEIGASEVAPLVHGLTQAEATAIAVEAREASGQNTTNMANWYRITVPSGLAAEALAALRSSSLVVHASRAADPPPPPSTPDFSPQQLYLDPAPAGVNSEFALADPRARGAGVTVVDLEYDWTGTHEDLQLPESTDIGGSQYIRYPFFDDEHGTAVFGVMAGKENGFGVNGGVPEATFKGISPTMSPGYGYNPAGALTFIAGQLERGDVVVIEQQVDGPDPGDSDYMPLEWDQASFNAIRQLSNLGVVVVEAGANGGHDLDAANKLGRFDRNLRDSDAILVGAGDSVTRAPLWYSSHGSRIDLQGHGQGIVTTGGDGNLHGGGLGELDFRYTDNFGGTSGATPIVANAVVSVLSYLKAIGQPPMGSDQIVTLLRDTGTPQTTPGLGQIGPLPDIQAAITTIEASKPSVVISGPPDGTLIDFDSARLAGFECVGGGPAVESCVATDQGPGGEVPLTSGERLPTDQPGPHTLTVTATNQMGLVATETVSYEVGPGCRATGVLLASVEPRGRKVQLLGAADPSLAGERVRILRNGRQTGSALVAVDGRIRASVKAPAAKKAKSRVGYRLVVSGKTSNAMKARGSVKVSSVKPVAGADQVKAKLAGVKKKGRLTLQSRPICGGPATSRQVSHDRRGNFKLRLGFQPAAQVFTIRKGRKNIPLPVVLPAARFALAG